LGFELGGVALSWLGFHLLVISGGHWSRNLAHLSLLVKFSSYGWLARFSLNGKGIDLFRTQMASFHPLVHPIHL
jgi:hypothetical protein